ncbi:hypothetical protein [Sphingomonas segetis]|jgi:hypothetical protein|nr:hypothetical protein [Sphingomonas segetis]
MPTTFLGLFLLSTALSLVATFTAVAVQAILKRIRASSGEGPARIR